MGPLDPSRLGAFLMRQMPPADSEVIERGNVLPLGTYRTPDGKETTTLAFPQPMREGLDALAYALGYRQDPNAPAGYVSHNALNKGGQGLAESAMVGSLAASRPRNALSMFAGRRAKTADHAALAKAEALDAQGASRDAIWSETGWFKGPDGQWRFEIDDSQAFWNGLKDGGQGYARSIMKHGDLYSAYPASGAVRMFSQEGADSGFNPRLDVIGIGQMERNKKSAALHEFQHYIQEKEGFSKGGSPDRGWNKDALMKQAEEIYNRPRKPISSEDKELLKELGLWDDTASAGPRKPWSDLTDRERMQYWETAREELYRKLAGEVEARTVEARRDLTPEQRSARPPWLDYDVPESNQIVRANPLAGAVPLAFPAPQEDRNQALARFLASGGA